MQGIAHVVLGPEQHGLRQDGGRGRGRNPAQGLVAQVPTILQELRERSVQRFRIKEGGAPAERVGMQDGPLRPGRLAELVQRRPPQRRLDGGLVEELDAFGQSARPEVLHVRCSELDAGTGVST